MLRGAQSGQIPVVGDPLFHHQERCLPGRLKRLVISGFGHLTMVFHTRKGAWWGRGIYLHIVCACVRVYACEKERERDVLVYVRAQIAYTLSQYLTPPTFYKTKLLAVIIMK